jgi:hypothetical protein
VFVVVAAFVGGLFVGVAGDRFYLFHHGRLFPPRHVPTFVTHRIVDHLDRELHLNPQQRTQLQQIMDRHHARIDSMMSGTRAQVRQDLEVANGEIERMLTPEQRQQFKKIRMRVHAGARRGMRPPF